jgi:hypothetical protein
MVKEKDNRSPLGIRSEPDLTVIKNIEKVLIIYILLYNIL